MSKKAITEFPVHELIEKRWSPRAYANRAVEKELLGSILEAARWAPSCYNEQPWHFLAATAHDKEQFELLAGCLVQQNLAWAGKAPVLMMSLARKHFSRNGKPNWYAVHDVGLATASLILQAEALGLSVHPMAGFDKDKARRTLQIPDEYEPVSMMAVGYVDDRRSREEGDRERKPLKEMVSGGSYGQPFQFGA